MHIRRSGRKSKNPLTPIQQTVNLYQLHSQELFQEVERLEIRLEQEEEAHRFWKAAFFEREC